MELEAGFEDQAREAILDELEHELVGKRDPMVFRAIQKSHGVLLTYGLQHGYDVEPIIDSLETPEVTRSRDSLEVTWGWDHPAAPFFHFGTSDHTVEGQPVLSFVWEDPPDEIRRQFEEEGDGWRVFFSKVEVAGLPESRWMTAALDFLERELT